MSKKQNILEEYLDFDDVLIKPRFSDVEFDDIDISTDISKKIRLKVPIIASPMDTICGYDMAINMGKLGGLGIIHRNQSIESQAEEVKKIADDSILVGAAIGLSDDFKNRAEALIKAGAYILCIDYSIGYSKREFDAVKYLLKKYDIEIIAGNIATEEAIKDYLKIGVRVFRFGSGGGSICISRSVTGVGAPQISALLNVKLLAQKEGVFIVADGGIRTSGDAVKALAAGANAVMLGSMISGTKETPGKIINIDGKEYKQYRGMGSASSMIDGSSDRYNQEGLGNLQPEGIEKNVIYKGEVKSVIENIVYGIKSGMLRVGVKSIRELQEKAEFIRI